MLPTSAPSGSSAPSSVTGTGLETLFSSRPSNSASPPSGADSVGSSVAASTTTGAGGGPLAHLLDNPVFAGGLGIASLGAAAALARRGLLSTASLLRRQLLVTVEVSKQDPSYPWLLAWLSAQPRDAAGGFLASRLTRVRHLSVSTSISRGGQVSSTNNAAAGAARPEGGARAHFLLQHGYGRHLIRHAGAYISVLREKGSTANHHTGEPHETLSLTTLYSSRHVFEAVFRSAAAMQAAAHEGRTVVYGARMAEWVPVGQPRRKRPIASVVLDDGVSDRLVSDVREFLSSASWYADRGIPYRRGYLLHGPPGGGKSSFILALAGEFDYGVATINLSERGMTDDRLAHLLANLPPRTLALLEDADAAFVNRRQRDGDGYSGASVTFSGLLNALDGVSAGEERVLFLTTNHVDRLDPALIRPGRVDVMVRVGEATRSQAGRMWDRFYGDLDDARGTARERFLARLDALGLFGGAGSSATTTAAIQGLFLFNKGDMEGAIRMAEGLVPKTYRAEGETTEGTVRSQL